MPPQIQQFIEASSATIASGGIEWKYGPLPAAETIGLLDEHNKDAGVSEQLGWRCKVMAAGLIPKASRDDCQCLPLYVVREVSEAILEASLKKSPEAN